MNAAQPPLVVTQIGARGSTYFAWAGPDSGGDSVDVTPDRGAHWWRAFLGDIGLLVVAAPDRLIAIVQTSPPSGPTHNRVYVSTDGGRIWHLGELEEAEPFGDLADCDIAVENSR